ncbi:MAG TPA: hypothetical protein PLV25_05950, partial [Opitutales bacterium]|nr:hypothetical protein [Opitutales bacterium]
KIIKKTISFEKPIANYSTQGISSYLASASYSPTRTASFMDESHVGVVSLKEGMKMENEIKQVGTDSAEADLVISSKSSIGTAPGAAAVDRNAQEYAELVHSAIAKTAPEHSFRIPEPQPILRNLQPSIKPFKKIVGLNMELASESNRGDRDFSTTPSRVFNASALKAAMGDAVGTENATVRDMEYPNAVVKDELYEEDPARRLKVNPPLYRMVDQTPLPTDEINSPQQSALNQAIAKDTTQSSQGTSMVINEPNINESANVGVPQKPTKATELLDYQPELMRMLEQFKRSQKPWARVSLPLPTGDEVMIRLKVVQGSIQVRFSAQSGDLRDIITDGWSKLTLFAQKSGLRLSGPEFEAHQQTLKTIPADAVGPNSNFVKSAGISHGQGVAIARQAIGARITNGDRRPNYTRPTKEFVPQWA